MFKFKRNRKTTTAKKANPIICKLTVFNLAIKAQIAEFTFTESDKHLIGAVKASYPKSQYKIETIYY